MEIFFTLLIAVLFVWKIVVEFRKVETERTLTPGPETGDGGRGGREEETFLLGHMLGQDADGSESA